MGRLPEPCETQRSVQRIYIKTRNEEYDLGVAFKYGTIGTLGVILSLLGTLGLSWIVRSDRISGQEGQAVGNIILIVVAGVAVSVIFLFVIIGGFIDRKLEAQGLSNLED